MRRLTPKQELFCFHYFLTQNATEAMKLAGYAPKCAGSNSFQVLKKPQVQARLKEFQEEAKGIEERFFEGKIMSLEERKVRLTEIARARLPDFMELGQDGSWVNIGPETERAGAIQEIHSRTEYDDDSSKATVHTSVKLHDPMKAIDLLNKMEKLYSDGSFIQQNFNRTVNILVIDAETRDLISQVAERTRIGNTDNQSFQGDSEGVGRGQEAD
jgi:phage terminase small subunit